MKDTQKVPSSKNPMDGIWNWYKSRVATVAAREAEREYKDRAFADEWSFIRLISKVLSMPLRFASGLTVANVAYCGFNNMWSGLHWSLSAFFAVLIALCLKALRAYSWGKFAKFTLKYKRLSLPVGSVAIALTVLSVAGSLCGAYLLPDTYSQLDQQPLTTEVDQYQLALARLDSTKAALQASLVATSSNSTRRALTASIKDQDTQRSKLMDQRAAHQQQLKEDADQRASERANATANAAFLSLVIMSVCELILLVISLFNSFYLFRLYIDTEYQNEDGNRTPNVPRSEDTSARSQADDQTPSVPRSHSSSREQQTLKQTQPTPQAQPEPQAQRRAVIQGFVNRSAAPQATTHQTVKPSQKKARRTRNCNHCGTLYEYTNGTSEYCSTSCRSKAYRNRNK